MTADALTLEQFRAVTRERIPTPAEFLGVVAGMGWRVARLDDGRPTLRGPEIQGDPLAVALARMLSREPYRTNVLNEMAARWRAQLPEVTPAPAPPVSAPPREWLWYSGHRHEEAPDDPWLFGHADRHPVGAWFWRYAGEKHWRPVPGRGGEAFVTPAGSLNGGPPDERRSV